MTQVRKRKKKSYYHRVGERLPRYSESNYCSICSIWQSKDKRYCSNCGLLIRTKPRNSKFKAVAFEY